MNRLPEQRSFIAVVVQLQGSPDFPEPAVTLAIARQPLAAGDWGCLDPCNRLFPINSEAKTNERDRSIVRK